MVITECVNCRFHNTIRRLTSNTNIDLDLLCGHTYTFSVRVVTSKGSSADKKTSMSINPQAASVVRNLAVEFLPGNKGIGGFRLTWDPPHNVKAATIKVGDKL